MRAPSASATLVLAAPLLLAAGLLVPVRASAAGSWSAGLEAGLASIEEDTIEEAVRWFSSPALEGRDSPSPGLDRALERVAGRFAAAGLVPAADSRAAWEAVRGGEEPPAWAVHEQGGVWLRPYRATSLGAYRNLERPDPERCALQVELEDGALALEYGRDFMPIAGCGGDVRGELVFAGFGIRSKRERYDDLRDLRLSGRIALVFEGEPRHPRRFEGEEVSQDSSLWEKLERLDEERVAGVLVVRRPPPGLEDEALLPFRSTWASWVGEPNEAPPRRLPPALLVSMEAAGRLSGLDLEEIAATIDRTARPVRERLDERRVSLRSVTQVGAVDLANVVGLLPGTGGGEEAVVVGAHADHIGVGPWGRVAHGADDNASGLSALCEIAEALALDPPRRNVYCVAFSAEEDGLVGSRAFCEAPPVRTADMVAMVNLDMIGRGDAREVVVLGESQNPGIQDVVEEARRRRTGVRRIDWCNDPALFQRSDHFSFHQAGVPAVFFFENYPIEQNEDYHTWRDVADLVDMEKVASTARLAYVTAWMLASDEDRLPPPRD